MGKLKQEGFMKLLCKFLIFLLCLNVTKLFSTPPEREVYLRQLSDIYFNPDASTMNGDESYKEEPLVGFLIELYSADTKSFNQLFEHFILNRQPPDRCAMYILEKKNLLTGDNILPCVKTAFNLCKKIAKNYCKDHKKFKMQIVLSPVNIIYILAYALAVGKSKDAQADPAAFRSRKRRTFGTLRLSILVPMVRAGEIKSFEDVLDFISVNTGNPSQYSLSLSSAAPSTSAAPSASAPSASATQPSFRERSRSIKQIQLKNWCLRKLVQLDNLKEL